MLGIPMLTSVAQRSQRHPNTCADLKNPGEVGMRERLASLRAEGFQRIVLVTAMDTSPKFLLVLLNGWWWECVSPGLEKPVCGGQCHRTGKNLGGNTGNPCVDTGTGTQPSPHQGQDQGELIFPLLPSSPLRRRIHTSVARDFANIPFSLQPSAEFHSSAGPKCFLQWDSLRK